MKEPIEQVADKTGGTYSNKQLPLGETLRDRVVALAKGGAGAIPFVGSLLGEIVGTIVPNQRLDRIESYLQKLNALMSNLSDRQKAVVLESPEHIDLIEEGAFRSARALSDERRIAIAQIVAGGLHADRQKALDQKRILDIYASLSEDELIVLLNYIIINRVETKSFYDKHSYLFEPLYATMHSSPQIRERAALREAIHVKLRGLSLTQEDESFSIKSDTARTLDRQMIEKKTSEIITELGCLVLQEAGLDRELQ